MSTTVTAAAIASMKMASSCSVLGLLLVVLVLQLEVMRPCEGGAVLQVDRVRERGWRKQLAGPPQEFKHYHAPSPASAALRSSSSFIPVKLLIQEEDLWRWNGSYPVDSDVEFTLSVFCDEDLRPNLSLFVRPPKQRGYTLLDDAVFARGDTKLSRSQHLFGMDSASMNVTTYTFPEPQVGLWDIKLESRVQPKLRANEVIPDIYLLFGNKSPFKVMVQLNTYNLRRNQQVGLLAKLYDETLPSSLVAANGSALIDSDNPLPLVNAVTEADMEVRLPDGTRVTMRMHDDGIHSDLLRNDGVYGATLDAFEDGEYVAETYIKGFYKGREFLRTTTHVFNVVPPWIHLGESATAERHPARNVIQFHLAVERLEEEVLPPRHTGLVKTYAEVWGMDKANQNAVPIAWVQTMADVVTDETTGGQSLTLELNTAWLQRAKAFPPFTLRNIQLQDPLENILLAGRDEMSVQFSDQKHLYSLLKLDYSVTPPITHEMTKGPHPHALRALAATRKNKATASSTGPSSRVEGGKLLLVHGYCSSANPWPLEDFTDYAIFEDYGKSISIDEFARKIADLGDNYPSFSTLAHSQGGMASLHLFTYYWSTMDLIPVDDDDDDDENSVASYYSDPYEVDDNKRILQSTGSPYRGTSLAGTLADLGAVFGLGCGSNYDLTTDGAGNWLSKIPLEARRQVFYYTSQYTEDWWFFSDCVTASNLILHTPNDGTTELKYAKLEGGQDQGHKEGWCHTTNMKDPPQTLDHDRNKINNQKAAR
ncbi:Conditioned medium factor [Balamuthia mandrillaris]